MKRFSLRKSKTSVPAEKVRLKPRRVIARWAAFLAITAGIVAWNCSITSFQDPYHIWGQQNFVVQNWGIVLIFVEAALLIVLKRMQRGVYWFWWVQLQHVQPTPKQQEVRNRAMVRSYGTALLVAFLFGPAAVTGLARFAEPARQHLTMCASWIIGLLLLGLPSILAAWDRDS